MLITIDVGNSRIKVAVFEQDILLDLIVVDPNEALPFFSGIFIQYPKIEKALFSSVGKFDNNVLAFIQKQVNTLVINQHTKFPFSNHYATPETLGIDRMVLAAGATIMFPNKNRLVIDAGTCVTYDFVDQDNRYFGGAISPGISSDCPILINELVGISSSIVLYYGFRLKVSNIIIKISVLNEKRWIK